MDVASNTEALHRRGARRAAASASYQVAARQDWLNSAIIGAKCEGVNPFGSAVRISSRGQSELDPCSMSQWLPTPGNCIHGVDEAWTFIGSIGGAETQGVWHGIADTGNGPQLMFMAVALGGAIIGGWGGAVSCVALRDEASLRRCIGGKLERFIHARHAGDPAA
eukprot:scaffold273154_cov35-Tisochrysis_lutea.AAC.2